MSESVWSDGWVPSERQVRAMAAVFAFSEAMADEGLSVVELQQVLERAVGGGWDTLLIQVEMLQVAVLRAGGDQISPQLRG